MKLAKQFAIPFVLEYNGSEIWINRHWGQALRYEQLSSQIELLNLQGADVIVVVSDALKAELISRGIDAKKILVNPNGVDSQRYSPEIDSSALRQQLTTHRQDSHRIYWYLWKMARCRSPVCRLW